MNMEYFWVYRTELPPGIGVKIFSIAHLTWVSMAILVITLMISLYRRQPESGKRVILVAAASLMALGYVGRWIWLASIGRYTIVENLPLQLCSIAVIVELFAVLKGNNTAKEFSYCCGLPGALASLIMPGMGSYPLFSYFYLQFAFAHTILILIPLLWILVDGYRPDFRNLPKCAGMFAIFICLAYAVNTRIGSNYMFLRHTRDNTLMSPFEKWLGHPGYLVPYAVFVLAAWIILYLPWQMGRQTQMAESSAPPS